MRAVPTRFLAAILALLCLSVPAVAQSAAPFDMTPEGASSGAPAPDATPGRPPPPTAPSAPPFSLGIAPDAEPPAPSRPPVGTDVSPPSGFERPIVPYDKLRLEGEIDERSWSIYLTAEQAADQVVLNIGYANAVVVAPETSQLRVFINDRLVVERPIAAPEGVARISAPVPAGLLQPGANIVRFQVAERHRTDCS
ncbi:MAG: cellulose biosynthesis cyclic di-GMP-binding regulatory protein BcsB, partial [Methylobacteriaceae bacterium]|nr:cellulose biosynthesis cyclic di-GMP-binding regulatory protein BcsB [Methylobacteriaceae bacterium]